jgi:Flp pilus assembly protein TadD
MYKEGIAEFEKVLVISPDNRVALLALGYAYGIAGRRAEAQKVLDQLSELSKRKYVVPRLKARIYVGLGDKDKAFAYLEESYQDRSMASGFGAINVDPTLDPLRSDPRFADLLRRMNLQP